MSTRIRQHKTGGSWTRNKTLPMRTVGNILITIIGQLPIVLVELKSLRDGRLGGKGRLRYRAFRVAGYSEAGKLFKNGSSS